MCFLLFLSLSQLCIKETKRSFTFGSDLFTYEKKTELAKFSRDELIKKANDEEVIEIEKKVTKSTKRIKNIKYLLYGLYYSF